MGQDNWQSFCVRLPHHCDQRAVMQKMLDQGVATRRGIMCSHRPSTELGWEWVVVDDHSQDATFAVITRLEERDPRVRGLRFARNFGAHIALTCGLHHAKGDCVVALPADLQDPPEVIPGLLDQWKAGVKLLWAARRPPDGESATTLGLVPLYYTEHRFSRSANRHPDLTPS